MHIPGKIIQMHNVTVVIQQEAVDKNQFMRKILFAFYILLFSTALYGQPRSGSITGKVSFIGPANIYVKFLSTSGISAGDTLFTVSGNNLIPALRVNNLSSTSCVCTPFSVTKFSMGDQIFTRNITGTKKTADKIVEKETKETTAKDTLTNITPVKSKTNPDALKQKIKGSVSAYSYTYFANASTPSTTRFRYTLNLDAENIGNSKFSVENYMSFNHKLGDWAPLKSDLFNDLKIYSLALRYDPDKTTHISIGRRINPRISSIGAMDGLQFEKSFNNFSLGAVAGTRPDYTDYGFNKNLFQYGAYFSYDVINSTSYNQSSAAVMQQTNSGKTDRRFLYFQQSNSLGKNLYFFGTFEVDLYKLKTDSLNPSGHALNTFSPTGLYLSLRYRMSNKLSFSGSYDARKNVIYYETYKTFIDRILETEFRQGYTFQGSYRITNSLTLGVTSGYRFLKSDPHPSKNINGYLTYYQIPGVKLSVTITGTYLESSYLNSKIIGGTISRDLLEGKLQTSVGYRYVDYIYPESLTKQIQHIGDMSFFWLFSKKMSFSLNYEGTFEKGDRYHMVFLQLRRRF
jgi:hypothetical protein